MTTSVQTVRAQIERLIFKGQRSPSAEFYHLREGGRWLAAQAWFQNDVPKVAARGCGMTIEEAAVVQVALQMAIDWIVEELHRREDFGPNGDATTPGFFR
jgi:hypothetical protein